MNKDTEVENIGIYIRNHWASSLTDKPGGNGLKSQTNII